MDGVLRRKQHFFIFLLQRDLSEVMFDEQGNTSSIPALIYTTAPEVFTVSSRMSHTFVKVHAQLMPLGSPGLDGK